MKIADLGLSHPDPSTSFVPFRPGGTPAYMAPELLTSKYATIESDIWAVGIIGYELCMLAHPFSGCNEWTMQEKIISGDIPSIPERKGGLVFVIVLVLYDCVTYDN